MVSEDEVEPVELGTAAVVAACETESEGGQRDEEGERRE